MAAKVTFRNLRIFWPIFNLNDVARRFCDRIALTSAFHDSALKNKPMLKFEPLKKWHSLKNGISFTPFGHFLKYGFDVTMMMSKSNQILVFDYICCIVPKRVTSLPDPSLRHCAWAAQLLSKKCHSGGEPLATL